MYSKNKVLQKLVLALRSGDYKQNCGGLRKDSVPLGPSFCVTGVLCDLYQKEHPKECYWRDTGFRMKTSSAYQFEYSFFGYMPTEVAEWAGLISKQGLLKAPIRRSEYLSDIRTLVDLNDSQYTFDQIAKLIEEDSLQEP